jgi:type III secretion protein Y
LLHLLGYIYGCHGQAKRGAAYLLIAAQLSPDNIEVLRTLTHLLTLDGDGEKALDTISRLESLDGNDHPTLPLLKSRALHAAGRKEEARQVFDRFLELQGGTGR